MDEETGEMKVKEETTMVATHLRLVDQFFGFSGSSGPSQVTCIQGERYATTIVVRPRLTRFGSSVDSVDCFAPREASKSRTTGTSSPTSTVSSGSFSSDCSSSTPEVRLERSGFSSPSLRLWVLPCTLSRPLQAEQSSKC